MRSPALAASSPGAETSTCFPAISDVVDNAPNRRDEFERLYRAHVDAVLAYLIRRASPDDAADAAAATFLVAWRRFGDVPEAAERPWLYATARRVLADQRRTARRQAAVAARVASEPPLPQVELELGADAAFEALATLDEDEREVLMLHAWEGLSGQEAALVLRCSPLAYRLRLHRARLRFRSAYRDIDAKPAPQRAVAPRVKENR